MHGDLLAGEKGPFHLVVSNPPYVASAELDALEPELRTEPREALIGEGGHEAVARAALETLVPGGALVLEVGDGQAGDVAARLRELGFREVRVSEDLAGRERVVEGRAAVTDAVVEAIRAGRPVILPTDTVYGLAADAFDEEAVRALYRLKGRGESAADRPAGGERRRRLRGGPGAPAGAGAAPRGLHADPPEPRAALPWLTGDRAETIGVRIPELTGEARAVLDQVGALAATSANLPGEPDPRRLEDVPRRFASDRRPRSTGRAAGHAVHGHRSHGPRSGRDSRRRGAIGEALAQLA